MTFPGTSDSCVSMGASSSCAAQTSPSIADEARQLVTAVSGRELTDDQIATLVDRTDGWAAGLQLAAITLQNEPDVAEFIESFAGTDRLIADYLLEEVIEQQPPDVQQFLLRTSVLDELTAELCDAVTGAGNARDDARPARRTVAVPDPPRPIR